MRGIVAALALSVGLVAATAASAGGPSLFPLGAGTSWTLSDERGNELTIRSNRSGSSYVLRGLPGLASVRVRANRRNIEAWDSRSSTWKAFLRLAAPAGTRYRVDFPEAPLWRAVDVTVESRSATCADARGRQVRGCVALALRSRKPVADAGVERLVFAPGVGLAEVVVQTIAGPRTYTLGGVGAPLE
jgi:hypothetical protein